MASDERLYWVWLQQTLKYGNHKVRTVLKIYKTAKNFYEAGLREWRLCGCFTKGELAAFENYSLKDAENIVKHCEKIGYRVIDIENDEYPALLRNIEDPPCVLYVWGDLKILKDRLSISIVGTRSATAAGNKHAFEFGFALSKLGIAVVSGGALGIDCCAQKGALQGGGPVISVLGCGINYPYLMENASLRNLIAKNGAVISEYPPDFPARPRNFPTRNRIISGLSHGVVVVEAGKRSGSLITANIALEQNRDVFAVPGNIHTPSTDGTNHLIKQGAKTVTAVEDILEEYEHILIVDGGSSKAKCDFSSRHAAPQGLEIDKRDDRRDTEETVDLSALSENALKVYKSLTHEVQHIDEICRSTGIHMPLVLQAITELELSELICAQSGKRYRLL